MQIRQLLDDRELFAGDRLDDAQGFPYALITHSSGDLVVAVEDGRPIRFKPKQLGCYVIHINRTERGLAKEWVRDYWEE